MHTRKVLHVARCKCRTQKSRQKSPSGHHPTTLSGYIFATTACIDNRKKNLLSSNISSRCPHNMVNFGLLAAEIVSLVWGTPANFNGFHVLAALLHGTLVVGVSQTAALNRDRYLYSAGRPSRWAFAHISSCVIFYDRGQWSSIMIIAFQVYICQNYGIVWYNYGMILHSSQGKFSKWNSCVILKSTSVSLLQGSV